MSYPGHYDWNPGHVPLTFKDVIFNLLPKVKQEVSLGTEMTFVPLHVGLG